MSPSLSDPIVQPGLKQLRLFTLRDPLTERFGSDYFRSLPRQPGVYFFYGNKGELLYIGQSLDLRARIGSYRHVTPEKNPKRTLRLVQRITRIEWQLCASASAAVELESSLLLQHRPPFNRAGVWQGDPWWLNVDAAEGKVHWQLRRKDGGIGPLPPGFRYAFGSLVRCLFWMAHPALPLNAYPHGLLGITVPLTLALPLPEAGAALDTITAFAEGQGMEFLAQLETLPLPESPLLQEYWSEEMEGLKRYAAKVRKISPPQSPHGRGADSRLEPASLF